MWVFMKKKSDIWLAIGSVLHTDTTFSTQISVFLSKLSGSVQVPEVRKAWSPP